MPSPTKDLWQAAAPASSASAGSGPHHGYHHHVNYNAAPHNPLLPATELIHAPPSPRTHRALRRLQSAHSLGAKVSSQQQQLLQAQFGAGAAAAAAAGAASFLPPPPPPITTQLQAHAAQLAQQLGQLSVTQQQGQSTTTNNSANNNSNNTNPQQPSLISQQRLLLREQHQLPHPAQHAAPVRTASPVRREPSGSSSSSGNTAGVTNNNPGAGAHLLQPPSSRSPQRGRANSEAQTVPHHLGMAAARRAAALGGRRSAPADQMSLERLLRDGPPDGDVAGALESTRLKILDQGIKSDSDGMSSLRIYVWLILLDAPVLSTDAYLALIHRGASPAYSKIRNDTFRTLTTDPLFRRRVSEASLIRLLNAIAWRLHDSRESAKERDRRESAIAAAAAAASAASGSRPSTGTVTARGGGNNNPFHHRPSLPLDLAAGPPGPDRHQHANGQAIAGSSPAARSSRARALTLTTEGSTESGGGGALASEPGTYVQGMNVLAAPFLYAARSEAEAFVAFHRLLTAECPGYIRGAMDGVHRGLALVDKVLAIVDPKLSLYLTSKNMAAEIYAFPSVLTLCACTPPLPEVLRLWDFLFAYGPHLNILCIVAQLELIRPQILASPSPNKLLRSFPALQADQIKAMTLTIIKRIPDDVYAEIVAHAK